MRYKLLSGKADIALSLSAKGSESSVADESKLCVLKGSDSFRSGDWIEKKFTVGEHASSLSGKELAMVALHFSNASDLDMRIGEFSIIRPGATSSCPDTPLVESAALLSSRHGEADGKIIFNMPNDKPLGEVCYNSDVKTSLFKLYACQDGESPVMMGMTSSWAGMLFGIPVKPLGGGKIKFGVSALSLDMSAESDIAWSEWYDLDGAYQISDDIHINKTVFKPGEDIEISYSDERHPVSTWILMDDADNVVAKSENSTSLTIEDGLPEIGNYTLRIDGLIHNEDGTTEPDSRIWPAIVQVSAVDKGAVPQIKTFTANSSSDMVNLPAGGDVELEFTADTGVANVSRGVKVGKTGLGIRYSETGAKTNSSFSVSFWFKPDDYKDKSLHLFSIRDKEDKWANNNWGWFWHILNEDGSTSEFTLRMGSNGNVSFEFEDTYITPGVWHHLAYVFDFDATRQVRPTFYLDGKKVEVRGWTRGDRYYDNATGEVPYFGSTYSWRPNNIIAVGGYTHKIGSVRGNVDNLAFFSSALNEEDVKTAMGDFDGAGPESLTGYIDFETDPDSEGLFLSKGNDSKQFRGGCIDYVDGEVEGTGTAIWKRPEYCVGSPFLSGNAHAISATVEIEAPGAIVSEINGDATSGKAKVSFPAEGSADRYVKVKVSNDYGSDSSVIPVKIGESGVISIESDEIMMPAPNPFTDRLSLTAPGDGIYRVVLSSLSGVVVTSNDFNCREGEVMTIYPEVPHGFYILSLISDNKIISTAKVLRR